MLLQPFLFQIRKIRDSSTAEELATLVEDTEKEDTKSVELPAMFLTQVTPNFTKEF